MKTALECLPCYLRQALQVARLSSDKKSLQLKVLQEVGTLLGEMDMELTPPENSIAVYQSIAEITGCNDPYLEIKRNSNEEALLLRSQFEKHIQGADDPLELALRLAIGGNIIDYGAMRSFDVDKALERCLHISLAVDDSMLLLQKIRGLQTGAKVLYLADNAGEIVYDALVVQELAAMGLAVTVAVKSGAIINDALMEDARAAGLGQYARLIENGTNCPGTPINCCSQEFLQLFNSAELIISKGQGNFETLSEVDRDIFFLLTVKCSVVGAHLAAISGISSQYLAGQGELVLYFSPGQNKTAQGVQ